MARCPHGSAERTVGTVALERAVRRAGAAAATVRVRGRLERGRRRGQRPREAHGRHSRPVRAAPVAPQKPLRALLLLLWWYWLLRLLQARVIRPAQSVVTEDQAAAQARRTPYDATSTAATHA